MKVSKVVSFAGVVMASLTAGFAQAAVVSGTAVISAQVAPIVVSCTVATNPLNFGAVAPGSAAKAVLGVSATCTSSAPYSYTFLSGNGGAGATGKLNGAGCSLDYAVVSYAVNNNLYGTTNYFITPQAAGSVTGTGVSQSGGFGLVVAPGQTGCPMAAGAAPIAVSDSLVVSVNY